MVICSHTVYSTRILPSTVIQQEHVGIEISAKLSTSLKRIEDTLILLPQVQAEPFTCYLQLAVALTKKMFHINGLMLLIAFILYIVCPTYIVSVFLNCLVAIVTKCAQLVHVHVEKHVLCTHVIHSGSFCYSSTDC